MTHNPPILVRLFRMASVNPYQLCERIAGRFAYALTFLTLVALVLPSVSPEAAAMFGRLDAVLPMPVFALVATLAACAVAIAGTALAAQASQGPGRVVATLPAAARVRVKRQVMRPVRAPMPAWASEFAE